MLAVPGDFIAQRFFHRPEMQTEFALAPGMIELRASRLARKQPHEIKGQERVKKLASARECVCRLRS